MNFENIIIELKTREEYNEFKKIKPEEFHLVDFRSSNYGYRGFGKAETIREYKSMPEVLKGEWEMYSFERFKKLFINNEIEYECW